MKKANTMMILHFISLTLVNAQNTSYSANTVPIFGTSCTAFGVGALVNNTSTGSGNSAIGASALQYNTTGSGNTSNGVAALQFNTTGSYNIANGASALRFNTTGSFNTANGTSALFFNVANSRSTAIGYQAMFYADDRIGGIGGGIETFNTAIGCEALKGSEFTATNTGRYNTAMGDKSLFSNSSGQSNCALGALSLYLNTIGNANTASGYGALNENISGSHNTGNGVGALGYNHTGFSNTVMGTYALYYNLAGNNNTALGDSSGYLSLGNGNVYIGNKSGANETGSNKFYLSNDAANTLIYGDFDKRQVLMGNANPTGYIFKGKRTLNVLGGILSDSVRVSLSANWADYVFADDYKLKPLRELENFIKTNKHLPNIPSAEEIAISGIELGAMNAKLLEKVEELTLYILQQQKQIDELRRIVIKQ